MGPGTRRGRSPSPAPAHRPLCLVPFQPLAPSLLHLFLGMSSVGFTKWSSSEPPAARPKTVTKLEVVRDGAGLQRDVSEQQNL